MLHIGIRSVTRSAELGTKIASESSRMIFSYFTVITSACFLFWPMLYTWTHRFYTLITCAAIISLHITDLQTLLSKDAATWLFLKWGLSQFLKLHLHLWTLCGVLMLQNKSPVSSSTLSITKRVALPPPGSTVDRLSVYLSTLHITARLL